MIELVVVIVILGILSATAVQRYTDLTSDARRANVHAAKGALLTVSETTHGKSLINVPADATLDMEGAPVAMVNGYPSSALTTATAAGLDGDEWVKTVNGRDLIVSPKGATAAQCKVTYSEAVSDGTVITPAALVIVDTGC